MAFGKCPTCEKTVSRVKIEAIEATAPNTASWNAVSYLCQSCHTVLSVGIDPLALKTDTINGILKGLKRH